MMVILWDVMQNSCTRCASLFCQVLYINYICQVLYINYMYICQVLYINYICQVLYIIIP